MTTYTELEGIEPTELKEIAGDPEASAALNSNYQDAEACRRVLLGQQEAQEAVRGVSTSEVITIALAFGRDDLLPMSIATSVRPGAALTTGSADLWMSRQGRSGRCNTSARPATGNPHIRRAEPLWLRSLIGGEGCWPRSRPTEPNCALPNWVISQRSESPSTGKRQVCTRIGPKRCCDRPKPAVRRNGIRRTAASPGPPFPPK